MAGGRKLRVMDRRSRSHFWVDDSVIDRFGPWLGRHAAGTAALAVYAVLARYAGRDAEAWPSVAVLSELTGASKRTVQRALRLLEVAGLIAVTECVDDATDRQTSSMYTLLAPTEPPAFEGELDWPPIARQRLRFRWVDGKRVLAEETNMRSGGCHTDTGEGVTQSPPPCHRDTHRARPYRVKENTEKELPSDDGFSRAIERWQATQERIQNGPFSKPRKPA